jgi:hypothetical protein
LTDEQLTQPTNETYTTSFAGGIFGDYNPHKVHHNYILLVTTAIPDKLLQDLNPKNMLHSYSFPINVGKTLKDGITRLLWENFGLEAFLHKHRLVDDGNYSVMVRVTCEFAPLRERAFNSLKLCRYQTSKTD